MTDRLDEQKLASLRRWAERLANGEREDVRAAGRAILLLSDEVERLRIELGDADDRQPPVLEAEPVAEPPALPSGATAAEVSETLRARIRAFASRTNTQ